MNKCKILTVGAALVLSACTTGMPTPKPVMPPPEQPTEEPSTDAIPPAPEPIVVDLSRINGQTPAEIQNYLGLPSFVRRDENVQIMHFQNDWCVAEIIFYEPENGGHFRANHISARTPTGASAGLTICLNDILAGN